jgi:hypothetical protein
VAFFSLIPSLPPVAEPETLKNTLEEKFKRCTFNILGRYHMS